MAIKVIDKKGVMYSGQHDLVTLKQGEFIDKKLIDAGHFTEQSLNNLQNKKRISGFEPSKALISKMEAEEKMTEEARELIPEKKAKKQANKVKRLEVREAKRKIRDMKQKSKKTIDKKAVVEDIKKKKADPKAKK